MLDKIKEASNNVKEFNAHRDDAIKELEAMALVAHRAYQDYTNTVGSSDYEFASEYYDKFTDMWDLRDEIMGKIDELNEFDEENYFQSVEDEIIDAETEYKLCVHGRA